MWCVYRKGKYVSLWVRKGRRRRRRGGGGRECAANLLLNPGWSRSWQAAEVRRTATSSFVSIVCRLHRWIIPYICVRGCGV